MPNNVSDHEMVTKSAAVAEAYTKEKYEYLLSLLPTPESFGEAHDRFEASYAAALKGDPEKVKACEVDRSAVNKNFAILAGLAKAIAHIDPTIMESLGLGHPTERVAPSTVSLKQPQGFKAVYNPKGEILASVARDPAAKGYQVWACNGDPNIEANWRLVASSPTCKGIVINGLNRAKTNWLRIRGMRGNVAGPWSNCVSLSPS